MAPSPRTRLELYFSSRFERAPQGIASAHGRLVLLGEHLDHQGGCVLAVPLAQGVHAAFAVRPDRRVVLHALNARASDTFTQGEAVRSGRRWGDLARGAAMSLAEGGRRLPGLDLAVFGDLPPGRGLASSAAYVAAILGAIAAAIGERLAPADVARRVADIEARWAGVNCGTMDPYVALAGAPGEVLHLDTRALTHETLALPEGTTLDPVDTGVERRLDETPYNERRRELEEAWTALRASRPELERLPDLAPASFEASASGLPEALRRRARHVVTETARVARAVEALRKTDSEALGRLVNESHASLSEDFACSTPEIDAQVEALQREEGVLGARLQGAGWGGTIAVLRRAAAP